jgi:hypothetical protein
LNVLSGHVQYIAGAFELEASHTALSIITNTIAGAKLTGRLLTNGLPRDQVEFANISAYVTQDDSLFAQLVNHMNFVFLHMYMCVVGRL